MAVSLPASLPFAADATCCKLSPCSYCFRRCSLSDRVSRGAGCPRITKHSQSKTKLKVTICQKSRTLTEVSNLRTSFGSLKLLAAGFTDYSGHDPLLFMGGHTSRNICVAAVATVASQNALASDESTIISAAEQAMAFAAAALNAAKCALELHEGEIGSDSFPSKQDTLKVEMLRLSELLKSRNFCGSGEVIVSDPDVGISQFFGDSTSLTQTSISRMDLDPDSTEMSAALCEFRKVLEETFSGIVDQESEHWSKQVFSSSRNGAVVVRSARRKERAHQREKASKKVDKVKRKPDALDPTVSTRNSLPSVSSKGSAGGFLRTIKKKRLLTSAEEKQLSGRVQFLLKVEKLKAAFKKSAGHEPTVQELANAIGVEPNAFQSKLWAGRQAKARMIYCNFGLVISIAKRFQGQGIPLQDLVQEGVLGLIRGIERFKPSLGFKLSTYAHWWIWEAISRAVNTKSKAAMVPVNVVETLSRVHKVREAFSEEHGRPPTEDELAKLAKLSLNRLRAIQFHTKAVKSADRPVGEDDFSTFGAYIVDESSESYQAYFNRQCIKEDVEALLLCLTEREKQIVRFRFPTDRRQGMTLEEIGVSFNVTRERIRQIERVAMQKLKSPQASHLKSYFEVL